MADPSETGIQVRQTYQQSLAPGEVIFEEGDPGDQLYIVQSGEVELVRVTSERQRTVARVGPGDFFGELGLVLGGARTARAVAVSTTRLIALDRETLEGMCLDQPEIAIRMIRVLVSRLIEAERRLSVLGADDVLRPIVRTLVRHGENTTETGMTIPLQLRQIAEAAGLSMLEAHRALHQLFDRKLVVLAEDVLTVPDRELLTAACD